MKNHRFTVLLLLIGLMIVLGLPGSVGAAVLSNDNFADAYAITGASGTTSGTNVGATLEDGETAVYGPNSVWWSWTAPSSGPFTFNTFGSNFDTVLQVFTGTEVSALTEIVYNDEAGSSHQSKVDFDAVSGVTYMICVRGYNDLSTGSIILNWSIWNDGFTDAITITGASGTTTGDNTGATTEVGEPFSWFSGRTIWWSWTAPESGYAAFDTLGSQIDTAIGVCTGTELGSLTLVGFNDDISSDCDSWTTFQVTAGTTYHIIVDSYGSSGPITLNWSYVAALNIPANDAFPGTVIGGSSGTSSVNNVYATREFAEPEHFYLSFSSVWWTWTAPASGDYEWDTKGSEALGALYGNDYMGIAIYTGDTVGGLALVTKDSYYGNPVHLTATEGTTYRIVVDSDFSSYWGIGDVVLNWRPILAPSFTSADHATFTVGDNGLFSVTSTGIPEPYVWMYSGYLPAGVSFTPGYGSGLLSGTPVAGSAGSYSLNLESYNSYGRVQQNFTLTVNEVPTITSANSTTFNIGTYGSFVVTTTGTPAPTVSLSAGALPSGMTFDQNTATLSGTPETGTDGTYELTFTADNGVGTAVNQLFTLNVINEYVPQISGQPQNTAVVLGDPVTFMVEYSAYPSAYIQWEMSSDGGRRWTSISGANSASYTTVNTKRNMDGNLYRVVLSNTRGTVVSDEAILTVMPEPFTTVDLVIDSDEGIHDGVYISWVIIVTNDGLEAATDVMVSNDLARGTRFFEILGLDSIPGAICKVRGGTVDVSLGELAASDSIAFTIRVEVTRATSPVANTATVETTSYDTDSDNNISETECYFE